MLESVPLESPFDQNGRGYSSSSFLFRSCTIVLLFGPITANMINLESLLLTKLAESALHFSLLFAIKKRLTPSPCSNPKPGFHLPPHPDDPPVVPFSADGFPTLLFSALLLQELFTLETTF